MKLILSLIVFIIFTVAVMFGGEYLYDQKIAKVNANVTKSTEVTGAINSNTNSKSNKAIQEGNIQQVNIQQVHDKTNSKKTIEKTPPHFFPGFDWSLPSDTKISTNSGFIADQGDSPEVVNNHFIIVKWDETNPSKGVYDFSKLEATLNKIAPKKALVRLEVNSSCEAPKWALNDLRETKRKSLIYWDKSYQDMIRPYINNFAKSFAAHSQILGVQLGLADGEFGEAIDSCNDYDNKQGWGEFWMSPSEREEAENRFGFNPEIFTKATIDNIDIYINAFGIHKNKLAFTNIGTLFTYGDGEEPYNENLKKIAKYVLDKGLGNRDGAIERWMSYTDKVYGNVFTTMPDGSCRLDIDEQYMRDLAGRYWGTENEFYGNKDYVIGDMGPVVNHPYIFLISSLRALQMRRNAISISDMRKINHPDYKIQAFMKYLMLTLGKQYEDTPDAFVLMGERYVIPYRLADQMDASCVNAQKDKVTVRSFGRWLTESPQNTEIENKPAIKITMPKSENNWYQGYYLPHGIDYEYFAREAKQFSFDVNDELSQYRCKNGCDVEIKATFKDTHKTTLHLQVAEGVSMPIETLGDNMIKTVNFKIQSQFNNQLKSVNHDKRKYKFIGEIIDRIFGKSDEDSPRSDLRLISDKQAIPLILMRINFNN